MVKTALLCGLLFLVTAALQSPLKGPRLSREFVWIPSDQQDKTNNPAGQLTGINDFYMSQFEVSNQQYRNFLAAVLPGLSATEAQQILIDTLGWRNEVRYCEPFVEYYHRHPAFNNYPVVNISYEGAMAYCKWLRQKVEKDNPRYSVDVTLPSKAQWIWAAQGGRSQAIYPWGNYYLRNRKGEYLCNFTRTPESYVVQDSATGKPVIKGLDAVATENALITANVRSFYPNGYKLYNMSGNVAEMIAEKGICMGGSWKSYGGEVTTTSEVKYAGPDPTIGFRPIIICMLKSGE